MVLTPAIAARYGQAVCAHVQPTPIHTDARSCANIQREQIQRSQAWSETQTSQRRLPHCVFAQPLLTTSQLHVWGTPCPFPG